MDSEVDDMMDQLSSAEQELAKKKAEADQDMIMASMVRATPPGNLNNALVPFLCKYLLSFRHLTTPRRQRTMHAKPKVLLRWS